MADRILITGGSGFIGTNLVEFYVGRGQTVQNLDKSPPRNAAHEAFWNQADLLDADGIARAFREFQPTLVLNMGARTDLGGASLVDYAANIEGVQNVVEAVAATPTVRRAVYASTRFVFNHGTVPRHMYDYSPHTVYGESKVKTEEIVRGQPESSVPWILIRPTSIWGPWFDVPYKSFFDAIQADRYIHPGNRRLPKTYGYVGNVVHEIDRFSNANEISALRKAFFVADYEPLDVLEWANLIQKAFGAAPVKKAPYPALKAVAIAGDLLRKFQIMREPPLTSFRLRNLITPLVYDMSDVEHIAGPLPFTLKAGVDLTVNWMKSRKKSP